MKDIGIYGFAYQIFKGMIFLTSGLSHYFLPFLSQHVDDKTKLRNYLSSKRPKIIALGLAGLVCIFFSVGYVLKLLYGDVYSQSIPVLQVLLIANAINLYTIFYTCLFYALKRYRFYQIATVFQIVINVILNFVFIPYIGILGAAVATVIAYFCRAVAMEGYFRLKLKKVLCNTPAAPKRPL
jgi:O-antigen/teichoic acid export membrane protein